MLRALWAGERVTHRGRHYTVDGVELRPRPVQERLPIWIGGNSPPALRRAARYDGWSADTTSPEGDARSRPEDLARSVATSGRSAVMDGVRRRRQRPDPAGADPAALRRGRRDVVARELPRHARQLRRDARGRTGAARRASRRAADARRRRTPPGGAAPPAARRRAASRSRRPNPRAQVGGSRSARRPPPRSRSRRSGKNLLLAFEGGYVLHSHLRMNGRWTLVPRGSDAARPTVARPPRLAGRGAAVERPGARAARARRSGRLGPDILAAPPDARRGCSRNLRARRPGPRGRRRAPRPAPRRRDRQQVEGGGALGRREVSPWRPLAETTGRGAARRARRRGRA